MAVISVTDYRAIITDYTTAIAALSGISDNYGDAATVIVQLNAFDPEIDLLIPFFNAYQTGIQAYANQPQSIIDAVKALQDHVLARTVPSDIYSSTTSGARYADINSFYADSTTANPADSNLDFTDQGTQLSAEFAVLSNQAGHTISDAYKL